MRLRKRKVSVGIDIGSRVVKVVVLSNTGAKNQKPKLLNYAVSAFSNNGDLPSDSYISSSIKNIFSEMHIEERYVNAAVSGNSAVVRYVNLRKMSADDLRDAIKFEAQQHIPFDIKDVEIDFSILEDKISSEPNMMRVLLVAAKKDECKRLIKILQGAGLTPVAIDVDSIALVNSYVYGNGNGNSPVALVNIGAKKTNVDIVNAGKPAFTRNIEIGGDGITLAIARGMNIDVKEAERMKICGEGIALEHIQIVLDSIIRQLRTSFDYYEGISGSEVSHVYISGGASMLSGLTEQLATSLNLPVEEWNPLNHIDTSAFSADEKLQVLRSTLDIALGLALRGVNSNAN